MGQTWRQLLFAHWRIPPERIRRLVPHELALDVRDGAAWIGVTPFLVSALHVPGIPPLPWISAFAETNVRTYVTVDGRPGIYFFSLDAARRLAVVAARCAYRVPYYHAKIRVSEADGWTHYALERFQRDGPAARLRVRYSATGAPFRAAAGSLDHFLTERYCLYTMDSRGRVLRGDIHHRPWCLQAAEVELAESTMGQWLGLELPGAPVLHLAQRQDVLFWPLASVDASRQLDGFGERGRDGAAEAASA
jgi:uncharacterized protein YqjF (DUF2071 family)